MRKKIIVILGIMLLSIMMFGCGKSDDLKLPKILELKDEYKNSVSIEFTKKLNKIVAKYIEVYNKENKLEQADLDQFLELSLSKDKTATDFNDTERLLIGKSSNVFRDLILEYDKPTEKTKANLKEDIQTLLDLYK
jgi:hypothetical protein